MRQVIYAWNYLEWGGAQIHLLALIKEVRKEFDTVVVVPTGTDRQFLNFLDELGVRYEFFRGHANMKAVSGLSSKLKRHWTKIKSEYAMLRHLEKFDLANSIVHVDLSPQQSLSSLVWLCLRTRVFITSHNSLPPVPKWREALWRLKYLAISRFETFNVFCSNEDAKKYFSGFYSRRVAERIKITYTSINPGEIDNVLSHDFDKTAVLRKHDLPTDRFVVLSVGQFIDRKGRWTMMESARKLVASSNDIQFVWLTPQLPDSDAMAKIEGYGLGDSFRLILSDSVGTARKDILGFFRIADVFALPSFVEGLPIALLEAMALGTASVSTRVNAIPEAIINRQTGLLVEAGDSDALANAISELKNDEHLRSSIARQGRDYVIEHFDERDAARTALESYKESFRD